MANHQKFNPAQFGLQGKRLAVVELNKLSDALSCIFSMGGEKLVSTLKSCYMFSMIPVMMDKGHYQGVPLVVVDADRAEKAFKYIRENASPELLAELKGKHEFDLEPIDTSSTKGFIAKCARFVLGVALMMLLLSALTGCSEAPADRVNIVKQGYVTFEQWGTVKEVELVRKTKRNDYRKIVTDKVIFSEINVKSFPNGYVKPGDVIGQEMRFTERKVNIKLCKNGMCVANSVCYKLMKCFERYETMQKLVLNMENSRQ